MAAGRTSNQEVSPVCALQKQGAEFCAAHRGDPLVEPLGDRIQRPLDEQVHVWSLAGSSVASGWRSISISEFGH